MVGARRRSRRAWRSRRRRRRSSCCPRRSSACGDRLVVARIGGRGHALADGAGRRALPSRASRPRQPSPRCSTRRSSRAPAGLLEPFRGAGTYLDRGIEPASHAHPWHYYLGLLTYSASGGLRWSEGLVLVLAVVGAIGGAGARRTSRVPARVLGALPHRLRRHRRRRSSRRFRTRRPGTCCRSTPCAFVARGRRVSRRSSRRRRRARCARVAGSGPRAGIGAPGMAGLARVGDLRRRSAQSVRLRPDRARRRPDGGAHPRVSPRSTPTARACRCR